jgi:5-methylcytosine-specific restriction endonuclease McrBC regulatory subunit McrC
LPEKLHVLYKDSQLYLQADGLAGIIPCKSGNSILIEPKCKDLHPFLMYEYINNLSLNQDTENAVDTEGSNIDLQTLAQYFANELIAIHCRQRLFKRLPVKKNRTAVKGKVNWSTTARQVASKQLAPIASTALESTYDIPENEVISMAASLCLPLFDHNTAEWSALFSWSSIKYNRALTKEALLKLKGILQNSQISGAHAYYYTPIALALSILGIDEAGNASTQDQSILFNMPGLYEDYIRTAFMRRSTLKGYSCQKSFVPRSFLFANGTCELEPDITIYDGKKPIAVLDVKYKVPDSKDYYQIFAYMKYAKLLKAYVISPYVRHNEAITAYDGSKIIGVNVSKSIHTQLEEIVSGVIDTL